LNSLENNINKNLNELKTKILQKDAKFNFETLYKCDTKTCSEDVEQYILNTTIKDWLKN